MFNLVGSFAIKGVDAAKAQIKAVTSEAKTGFGEAEAASESSSGKISAAVSKLGGAIGTAAKVGIAALLTTSTIAFGALSMVTKGALDAYASYEQLTGGVETLFKDSAPAVEAYAANAYKTAGMSANAYMETVTSFSASLLQGLGGDTAAATEYANMAVTDMSDNANKMGTSIGSIQDAYQGFAKQNYTMLDNLKLGYGGTQSEMARLINDSGVLGDSMTVTAETVNQVSFDKVVEAIHTVQTEMGITGTTAKEASTTIEGSVNSAKAAWTNWLVGLADDNANMEQLTTQLVESISTAASNIIPRLVQIMTTLGTVLVQQLPTIFGQLQMAFGQYGPQLLQAAGMLFAMIGQALINSGPDVLTYLLDLVNQMVQYLMANMPAIMDGAGSFFSGILTALGQNGPQILQGLLDLITQLCQYLIDNMPAIVDGAFQFFGGLIVALAQAAPQIAAQLLLVLATLIVTVLGKIGEMISAGAELIGGMVSGFLSVNVLEPINGIIGQVTGFFSDAGTWLLDSGKAIIQGLIDGIMGMVGEAGKAISGVMDTIASFLPHSPAKKGAFSGRGWSLYSGQAITEALGEGIAGRASRAVSAMSGVMSDVAEASSSYSLSANVSATTARATGMQGATDNTSESYTQTSNMVDLISRAVVLLQEILDKDGNVYMDGKRVGAVMAPAINEQLGLLQVAKAR